MINPDQVTKFDRTHAELEEFFLFCVVVAGKGAYVQAVKLEQFLAPAKLKNMSPFEYIKYLVSKDMLMPMVREVRLGQYKRLTTCFEKAVDLNLAEVTVNDLELLPGVGPKTSRFFVLHSRPNQRLAVLDTHILSWMRENLNIQTVPKSTPQAPSRYRALEEAFLEEAARLNIRPEMLDLKIWRERSRGVVYDPASLQEDYYFFTKTA